MALVGTLTTNKLVAKLTGSEGLPGAVADLAAGQSLSLPSIGAGQIIAQNVAPDISEKSTIIQYPLVCVYCTTVSNLLREKFRTFSGDARMVIEMRVSQDRLDEIESNVQSYVDAVTNVLDQSRGDWGDGVFYAGGYEVAYSGVKHGGKNFLQIAKVTIVLEISTN